MWEALLVLIVVAFGFFGLPVLCWGIGSRIAERSRVINAALLDDREPCGACIKEKRGEFIACPGCEYREQQMALLREPERWRRVLDVRKYHGTA